MESFLRYAAARRPAAGGSRALAPGTRRPSSETRVVRPAGGRTPRTPPPRPTPLTAPPFPDLSSLGLAEYYPRFAAQGLDAVADLRARADDLEPVLESVGMDANPAHAATLANALAATEGDDDKARSDAPSKKKRKKPDPGPVDPAAAIRAAMEASRRRAGGGGGGGGGGQTGGGVMNRLARLKAMERSKAAATASPDEGAPPSAQQKPRAAASSVPDAEILSVLAAAERGDVFGVLRLPPAPVDRRGACDWDSHPASKAGRLAMDAKTYRMRLDASDHPRAGDASRAVRDAVEVLAGGDKDARRRVLTEETRRRVDAMRRSGAIDDDGGGYVSMTGIHHAAGAAAASAADFRRETDANAVGPATNPAMRAASAYAHASARGGEEGGGGGRGDANGIGGGDEDDPRRRKTMMPANATAGKVDLGSIRDKLKKKAGGARPRFM